MKFHESVAVAFKQVGVDTMFGLVGDANLLTVHHFCELAGTKYVSAAHEAGAALMAIGYSSVSERLGVATVTHGPGLANTFTPLVHGVRSRTPMVLLAADTPAADRDHLQHLPQREMVTASGAG